jgi:hypothetical protein
MNYSRRLENVLQQINLNKNDIQEFSKYLISKETRANYEKLCENSADLYRFFTINKRKNSNLTEINSIDDIISFN